MNTAVEDQALEDLKGAACATIDRQRGAIIALGEEVWARPESGYKEYETARRMAGLFKNMGLACQEGLALTGVRTELDGAQPGPTLALLGEMDGIILPGHPAADPATGAVHACGHNAQLAGLYGAALALNQPGIRRQLAGRVVLMAVPAEEYLELDFRRQLVRDNKIRFLGGKQELIRLGHFRDVQLALMIHACTGRGAQIRRSMNGFTAHHVRFTGRAAHAGMSPHQGVNALNAALLALQAVNALRDTFPEGQHVRVHSVLKKGGDSVNTVPAEALLETMARAKTVAAINEAAAKARRCYQAGALALGGKVVIESFPGYLPLNDCRPLAEVFKRNVAAFVGASNIREDDHLASSTDMGDVTQIMPASHPGLGGMEGAPHSAAFRIADPELAYVTPAKILAMCALDLLSRQAALARQIIARHPPAIAPDAYPAVIQQQAGEEIYDYLR